MSSTWNEGGFRRRKNFLIFFNFYRSRSPPVDSFFPLSLADSDWSGQWSFLSNWDASKDEDGQKEELMGWSGGQAEKQSNETELMMENFICHEVFPLPFSLCFCSKMIWVPYNLIFILQWRREKMAHYRKRKSHFTPNIVHFSFSFDPQKPFQKSFTFGAKATPSDVVKATWEPRPTGSSSFSHLNQFNSSEFDERSERQHAVDAFTEYSMTLCQSWASPRVTYHNGYGKSSLGAFIHHSFSDRTKAPKAKAIPRKSKRNQNLITSDCLHAFCLLTFSKVPRSF